MTKRHICKTCHIKLPVYQIFRCSNCQKAYYCSKDCQIKDWDKHEKICKKKEKIKTPDIKDTRYSFCFIC